KKKLMSMGYGVGGLVFGVWGIGPKPQSPIPNPQSPIPNPHFILFVFYQDKINIKNIKILFKNY
ncbi:MAG: hypothetical protein VZQ49_06785, partial [Methanobrevibacter sp.]|nr:hypothetical protein [Methanobrevibacter sp.]